MLSARTQCLGSRWKRNQEHSRYGKRWVCQRNDHQRTQRVCLHTGGLPMSKKNRISTRTSKHHRLPSSRGGATNTHNCVMISPELHQLWHKWFQNETPAEIQVEICRTFYGFSEEQMRDTRVEAFLDMVSSITEAKDRRV